MADNTSVNLIFLVFLVASACSNNNTNKTVANSKFPDKEQIKRLDSTLSKNACVNNISTWKRMYYFSKPTIKSPTNTNLISFTLMRAHKNEIGVGIEVLEPGGLSKPDDLQADVVQGEYNLRTNALSIIYCGPNQLPFNKRRD